MRKNVKIRTGETNINTYGSKMTIIEYINNENITVEFDSGYIIKSRYLEFRKGSIKSPYCKSVYGIGYLGEGIYLSHIDNKINPRYETWKGMLRRCYDPKSLKTRPTYIGCSVCEEWHNFQNFAKWYDENYYEIEKQQMDLDKDILIKCNKIYSLRTCVFVSHDINSLFIRSNASRGDLPIGVTYNKNTRMYLAQCRDGYFKNNKSKNLGEYNTPDEAFYLGYKPFKEKYIKKVADKYKDKIPQKLYNAMYNWVVEITD